MSEDATKTRQSTRTAVIHKRPAVDALTPPISPKVRRRQSTVDVDAGFEFVCRRLLKLEKLKRRRNDWQSLLHYMRGNCPIQEFDNWLIDNKPVVQSVFAKDLELIDLSAFLEQFVKASSPVKVKAEPIVAEDQIPSTSTQSTTPLLTAQTSSPTKGTSGDGPLSPVSAVTPKPVTETPKAIHTDGNSRDKISFSPKPVSPRTPKLEVSESVTVTGGKKSPAKVQSHKRPRPSDSPAEGSIELAARQEATVLSRIGELRRQGLWSHRRLPRCVDPGRAKTHWDYVLEEMRWMHVDFTQERRFKRAAGRKFASLCARRLKEEELAEARKRAEAERELRRISSFIAKQVREFWNSLDKVLEYKSQAIIDAKKRKALDQHLDYIVGQTEKFSSMVQEGLNRSDSPSTIGTKSPSIASKENNDDEFEAGSSSDDESTIAKAEKRLNKSAVTDEVAALQKESELDMDDWLNIIPEGYLEARDRPLSEMGSSDGESTREDTDDSDDGDDVRSNSENEEDNERPSSSKSSSSSLQQPPKVDIDSTPHPSRPSSQMGSAFENVNFNKLQSANSEERCEELTHIAEEAEKFQPKGFTIETAKVVTKVPFLLKHVLREYQHVGLDWLLTLYDKSLNGILADEMGLGKTIQTIALLAYLACERGNWGPHLIVVPTTVLLNWEMEFKKWCPAFKILTYFGSRKERHEKRKGWSKPNTLHVCITSYKLVTQDIRVFKQKRWEYFVLDEAQNIKNFKSQRWQFMMNMNARRRLLLTGTPLQNNLMELWSLMHFLMPNIFQSHKDFRDWFNNPLTGMIEGSQQYDSQIVQRLHKVLRPFILRRLKSQVEKQLPKKYEHLLNCPLSKRQRYLYDDFMSRGSTKDELSSGNVMSVLSILMQLRKVCNHPNLFEQRPVVSPFALAPFTYYLPSLVLDLTKNDPIENVRVPEILLVGESKMASERRRQLASNRKLIEDFDSNKLETAPPLPVDSSFKFPSQIVSKVENGPNRMLVSEPDFVVPSTVAQNMNLRAPIWININGKMTTTVPVPVKFHLPQTDNTRQSIETIGLKVESEKSPKQAPLYSLVTSDGRPTLVASTVSASHSIPLTISNVIDSLSRSTPIVSAVPVSLISTTARPVGPSILVKSGQSVISARTDVGPGSGWHPIRSRQPVGSVGPFGIAPKAFQYSGQFQRPTITVTEQTRLPPSVIPLNPRAVSQPRPIRPAVKGGSWQPLQKSNTFQGVVTTTTTFTTATSSQSPSRLVSSVPVSVEPNDWSPPPKKAKLETSMTHDYVTEVSQEKKSLSAPKLKSAVVTRKTDKPDELNVHEIVQRRKNWRSTLLRRLSHNNLRNCRSTEYLFSHNLLNLMQSMIEDDQEPCEMELEPSDRVLIWLKTVIDRLIITVHPALTQCPRMETTSSGRCPYWEQEDKDFIRDFTQQWLPIISPLQNRINISHQLQFPELRLIEYDCGKLQEMTILLRQLKAGDHRCLIFTQMSRMLDVLEAFLSYHGYKYLRLDGSTKIEHRQVLMERFNTDNRMFCFILSTRSGGIGVNLTGADTVIFYDSDWNPTMDAQAQDRCHRIGQTRDVHIYRLISKQTVEENILKKATQKRKLGEIAIEEAGFTSEFFKKSNIRELFDVNVEQQEIEEENVNEKDVEQAMENFEDTQDVEAAHRLREEGKAELAEFDEKDSGKDPYFDDPEVNKMETELSSLISQLKPVERYALKFLENEQLPEFEDELKRTESEIEQQKQEWAREHEHGIEEEEEKLNEDERQEFDLTYLADQNGPEMYCPLDPNEVMSMWLPPSPPPSDSEPDIYIDPVLNFWYQSEPMAESQLPPVYQEQKQCSPQKSEPTSISSCQQTVRPSIVETVTAVHSRVHKSAMREKRTSASGSTSTEILTVHSYTPKSLFDGGPSSKTRPDVRRALTPPPAVLEQENYEGPEWCVIEDLVMLMTITKQQQMTYNLLSANFGHTPNWDLVSKVVSEKWDHFRSPRQCSLRYQLVVLPREEGRLVAMDPITKKPRKCPLSNQELANMKKGRVKTAQQFQHDGQQLMNWRTHNRFKALKASLVRRTSPLKPRRCFVSSESIPSKLNEIHGHFLNTHAVSYDAVFTPLQLAELREERMRERKKQEKIRQQTQLVEQQQRQRQQELEQQQSQTRISAGASNVQAQSSSSDYGSSSSGYNVMAPGCRITSGATTHQRRPEQQSHLPKDHQDLASPAQGSIAISAPYTVVISPDNVSPAVTIQAHTTNMPSRTQAYATARVQQSAGTYRPIAPHQVTKQRTPPGTPMPQYSQMYGSRSTMSVSGQQHPIQIEAAIGSSGEGLARPLPQGATARVQHMQDIRPKVALTQSTGQQHFGGGRILVPAEVGAQGGRTAYYVPAPSNQPRMTTQGRAFAAQIGRRTAAVSLPKIQTLGQGRSPIMLQGQPVTRVTPTGQLHQMRSVGRTIQSAQQSGKIPSINVIMPVVRQEVVTVNQGGQPSDCQQTITTTTTSIIESTQQQQYRERIQQQANTDD